LNHYPTTGGNLGGGFGVLEKNVAYRAQTYSLTNRAPHLGVSAACATIRWMISAAVGMSLTN